MVATSSASKTARFPALCCHAGRYSKSGEAGMISRQARGPAKRLSMGSASLAAAAAFTVLTAAAPVARSQLQVPLVDPRSVAPFVPTPWHVIDRMLMEAGVTEDDVVFDLGSGTGRFLLRAAKDLGARGAGYEINPDLVEEARSAVDAAGVSDQVEIRQGDMFEADLSQATVVTLFLTSAAQRRLGPKLLAELRPGTRIACYKWEIPGWNPSKTVTVPVSGSEQPIFVYWVGLHN